MTRINAEQFGAICNGVWSDRSAVLEGRGPLTGEAALVRAVFWRLCKAGVQPAKSADGDSSKPTVRTYQLVVGCMLELNARPPFDGAPILNELLGRYQNEIGSSA